MLKMLQSNFRMVSNVLQPPSDKSQLMRLVLNSSGEAELSSSELWSTISNSSVSVRKRGVTFDLDLSFTLI